MEKRACGKASLELAVMGIGCWSFGGGAYWGAQDQKDVEAVVKTALDAGCNYFDTAEMYNDGESERSLGKALGRRRAEAIICTKTGPQNAHRTDLRRKCDEALARLGSDYIDIFMIHWPFDRPSTRQHTSDQAVLKRPPMAAEAFGALMELRTEGKIRYIGVSNFGVQQLTEALATGADIAVNELAYNLLARAIEHRIAPLCRERGVGIIGYMPLMQGLLSDKFSTFDDMLPERTRTRHFSSRRAGVRHEEPGFEAETMEALKAIRIIACDAKLSVSRLAIAWAAAHPAITCVLAGTRNSQQVEDNIQGTDIQLSDPIMRALDAATRPLMEKWGPSPDLWTNAANNRIE